MLAAPILIDRWMTNYWAGLSGKGNRINPRWRPNKKRKGHQHGPGPISIICQLPGPLDSHCSLPLTLKLLRKKVFSKSLTVELKTSIDKVTLTTNNLGKTSFKT